MLHAGRAFFRPFPDVHERKRLERFAADTCSAHVTHRGDSCGVQSGVQRDGPRDVQRDGAFFGSRLGPVGTCALRCSLHE